MRLLFCVAVNGAPAPIPHGTPQPRLANTEAWKTGIHSDVTMELRNIADDIKDDGGTRADFAVILQNDYPDLTADQRENVLNHFFPESALQVADTGNKFLAG